MEVFLQSDVWTEDQTGQPFLVLLEVESYSTYFKFIIAYVGNVLHHLEGLLFIFIRLFVSFDRGSDYLVEMFLEQTSSFGTVDSLVIEVMSVMNVLLNADMMWPNDSSASVMSAVLFLNELLQHSIATIALFVSTESLKTLSI